MVDKYCTCEATGLCYASLSVRMVNRCVAAGCSNTPSEGISLYKFPTDPRLREKWVKQVRRTRAHWNVTKYSFICSEHFTDDSFEVDSAIAASFGMDKKRWQTLCPRYSTGLQPLILQLPRRRQRERGHPIL